MLSLSDHSLFGMLSDCRHNTPASAFPFFLLWWGFSTRDGSTIIVFVFVCVCLFVCFVCVCVCVRVGFCIYVYIYVYMCVYVCVCASSDLKEGITDSGIIALAEAGCGDALTNLSLSSE